MTLHPIPSEFPYENENENMRKILFSFLSVYPAFALLFISRGGNTLCVAVCQDVVSSD
jgi:hypothetical protein